MKQKMSKDDERLDQYDDEINAMYSGVLDALEKEENYDDFRGIARGNKRRLHNVIFRMRKEQRGKGIRGIPKNIAEDGMVRNYEAFFFDKAYQDAKKRFTTKRRLWTPVEITKLIKSRDEGVKFKDIAKSLARSHKSVSSKYYRLKKSGQIPK